MFTIVERMPRILWCVSMKRVNNTSKRLDILSPMAQGTPRRYDAEYHRNGVSNLFMIFAPLQGVRHVQVTDQRTSIDFAHICRDIVDLHFPEAERIYARSAIISIRINPLHCIKPLNPMKPDASRKNFSSITRRNMEVG